MRSFVALVLTTQAATLAAGIAAIAAVLKLLVDALSARGEAAHAAHRTVLQPYLAPLGRGIHEVTAGVVLVHRRIKEGQAPGFLTPLEAREHLLRQAAVA